MQRKLGDSINNGTQLTPIVINVAGDGLLSDCDANRGIFGSPSTVTVGLLHRVLLLLFVGP